MKNWILRKWDWWIYGRAFHSFRRLCESNQGFAYLFELHLRDYRAAHPIPESLEKATESFYTTLRSNAEVTCGQRTQPTKEEEKP